MWSTIIFGTPLKHLFSTKILTNINYSRRYNDIKFGIDLKNSEMDQLKHDISKSAYVGSKIF